MKSITLSTRQLVSPPAKDVASLNMDRIEVALDVFQELRFAAILEAPKNMYEKSVTLPVSVQVERPLPVKFRDS